MKIQVFKIIVGFILFTFIGIKYHPEFHEPSFFIKHKPSLKIEYFSPISESDLTLNDLTGKIKDEEIAYQEFVGNYFYNDTFDNLAIFIIPLMSTLILSGTLKLFGIIKKRDNWTNLILGYTSNLLLLFITFGIYWNLEIQGLIMIIVYWIFSTYSIMLINKLNHLFIFFLVL